MHGQRRGVMLQLTTADMGMLGDMRAACVAARDALAKTSAGHLAVRDTLIRKVNEAAKTLRVDALAHLLTRTGQEMHRSCGVGITTDGLLRVRANKSIGSPKVTPESYRPFRAFVDGMLYTLAELGVR